MFRNGFEYRIGRSRADGKASVAGPYVTIRAGGPLHGQVTLTAIGPADRVIVEATWGAPHARSALSAEREGHGVGNELAQMWANDLAAGIEPAAN
jgi:hypothetical protein